MIETVAPNPALADLDGDGRLEIIYPSYDGKVHAYWLDKTAHGSWPYTIPTSGAPGDDFRFASVVLVGAQAAQRANFATTVGSTEAAAPVRKNPYIIQRSNPRRVLAHDEARWEEALFWEWKDPLPDSDAPWKRLLTYQVNLPNKKDDKDWGEIDLLGVSRQQLPLVVELSSPW